MLSLTNEEKEYLLILLQHEMSRVFEENSDTKLACKKANLCKDIIIKLNKD